jgi:hypothetical protein
VDKPAPAQNIDQKPYPQYETTHKFRPRSNNCLDGLSWWYKPRSSFNTSEAGQKGRKGTAGADQAHDGGTA